MAQQQIHKCELTVHSSDLILGCDVYKQRINNYVQISVNVIFYEYHQ